MLTHVHKCWKLVGVDTFAQGMTKRSVGVHCTWPDAVPGVIGRARCLTLGVTSSSGLTGHWPGGMTGRAPSTVHCLATQAKGDRTLGESGQWWPDASGHDLEALGALWIALDYGGCWVRSLDKQVRSDWLKHAHVGSRWAPTAKFKRLVHVAALQRPTASGHVCKVQSYRNFQDERANGYVTCWGSINRCWPALAHSLGHFDHWYILVS
jgi:hypothetical protein